MKDAFLQTPELQILWCLVGAFVQSLFFSVALPGCLHHVAAWFYGLNRTGFPRCPHLWVGSSPPGGLRSCGKPREKHGPTASGTTWLLCGAQLLQKLFLCDASGECWCSSDLKLTRQRLKILQQVRQACWVVPEPKKRGDSLASKNTAC